MTTDIVERLRHAHTRNLPLDDGLMGQAAYEIERLRCIIDNIHPQMQATIDRLTKDNADISAACKEGWDQARKRQDQIRNLEAEIERLRLACTTMNTEICQRLGKALGYPWFKDDQEIFPGATEENGVCTGEHVAESLAAEAADWIGKLEAQRDRAVEARNLAIKEVADMARQAGSWRGIAEGKDIVIQQLEAERERLKAIVNWLNPHGLAVGPIINTKEVGHE